MENLGSAQSPRLAMQCCRHFPHKVAAPPLVPHLCWQLLAYIIVARLAIRLAMEPIRFAEPEF
jgi:hypothetical protein